MKEEEKIAGGKVKTWGIRYPVPAPVLKGIGLDVGDEVEWEIKEVDGKKVAVLSKKEPKSQPIEEWVKEQGGLE